VEESACIINLIQWAFIHISVQVASKFWVVISWSLVFMSLYVSRNNVPYFIWKGL